MNQKILHYEPKKYHTMNQKKSHYEPKKYHTMNQKNLNKLSDVKLKKKQSSDTEFYPRVINETNVTFLNDEPNST